MANTFNARRLVVLVVVIFVIVLSFFAGRYTAHKPYVNPDNIGSDASGPADRTGIPPDSLPH